MSFLDSEYLLNNFSMFTYEIIEKLLKKKQVEKIENQIILADTVRVANLASKNEFSSWINSKERDIWRLEKTKEEKNREAMQVWDGLAKAQNMVKKRK